MAMSSENADYVALYLTCLRPQVSDQKMETLILAAIEVYPDASSLSLLEGDLLLAKNNQAGAEEAYEKAYSQALTKWDQAAALNAIGVLWAGRGSYDKAEARFAQALRVKPYDAAIRANWLQACEDAGRPQVE